MPEDFLHEKSSFCSAAFILRIYLSVPILSSLPAIGRCGMTSRLPSAYPKSIRVVRRPGNDCHNYCHGYLPLQSTDCPRYETAPARRTSFDSSPQFRIGFSERGHNKRRDTVLNPPLIVLPKHLSQDHIVVSLILVVLELAFR